MHAAERQWLPDQVTDKCTLSEQRKIALFWTRFKRRFDIMGLDIFLLLEEYFEGDMGKKVHLYIRLALYLSFSNKETG